MPFFAKNFTKLLNQLVKNNLKLNSHFCCFSEKSEVATFTSLTDKSSGIIIGTLCSERNRNALSYELIKTLNNSFDEIKSNPQAKVLILKSNVKNVFCAGADLKERQAMPDVEVSNFVTGLRALMTKLSELPIPVIAAINGAAFGGGLELALACDIRVASNTSTLGLVETHLGIIPGAGGTQRLSRVVGVAKAKELIFTGAKLSAEEAYKIGLINYFVNDPFEKSLELSNQILKASPIAIRAAKMAIDRGFEVDINSGMLFEQLGYSQIVYTKDRKEGMKAFFEKRKPIFIGS